MIKHLTRHGNSLALVIDRGVLELLAIQADTPLSLTTDGTSLVITPTHDAKRRRSFRKALALMNKRDSRALKRLAE
jgi:antitoxin component of MazEF toxin-antitoxin module